MSVTDPDDPGGVLVRADEADLLGGSGADVLIVFAPGTERFDYYRSLDRLHRGEASAQDIVDTEDRFDNHDVDSPLWKESS